MSSVRNLIDDLDDEGRRIKKISIEFSDVEEDDEDECEEEDEGDEEDDLEDEDDSDDDDE